MTDNSEPKSPPASGENTTQSSQQVVAPRSGLPPFRPFDLIGDPSSVAHRWKKWLRRFENLLISLQEFDSTIYGADFC